MNIPILIEPVAGNGYRARGGEPFGVTVEGETREEVIRKVRETIAERIRAGAEIVNLEMAAPTNPWLSIAGSLNPEDPLVQEWKQIMAENRRKADEDPNY